MDVQQFVWIVGHGPVLVHKQFCVDIPRNRRFRLNGRLLSTDVYTSVQHIYETCNIHYYQYTKWMNQSMGNFMVQELQRLFADVCIVPIPYTYSVYGVYDKGISMYIDATMGVRLIDCDTMDCVRQVRVRCRKSLTTERYHLRISF